MFCGEMAETKEHIDLPDCEYEGLFELLRYIYTDEVCLNGENVMQVLYLAEKYMIPGLTSECTAYLGGNLDLSNVFCVFKHAQQYDNKDLLVYCWDLIDKETVEALESSEFVSMERSFLNQLVERNTLSVREVELFKALDCWAKEECKRQNLKADGSVKRQVLGEQIVKNIRFPVMKQTEFTDVVLESKILTQEETSNIMKYFNSPLTSPVGFLEGHRVGSLLRCCRFETFSYGFCIENDPNDDSNRLQLKVDKDIMLHGISVLGNNGGEFTATVKIYLFVLDNDDDDDETIITCTSKTGTFTSGLREFSNGFFFGFYVIFDDPVAVKKEYRYIIDTSVNGPGFYYGIEEINEGYFSGVNFDFKPVFLDEHFYGRNHTVCAELLFKVTE